MWTIGSLSFATPWVLAFLALLPVLWWLLRVVPPAPRRLTFPAIRLLLGLKDERQTSAHSPWWLVLLRLILAAAVIVAVARPLLDVRPLGFDGPLFLAVDDDWASAKDWRARHALMDSLIGQAERDGRLVALLPTAPPADGGKVAVVGPVAAAAARGIVDAMQPLPWPADRKAALDAIAAANLKSPMRVVWVADGLDDGAASGFAARLAALGAPEIATPDSPALAKLLFPPDPASVDLVAVLRRAQTGAIEPSTVRAADSAGRTLAEVTASFGAGERQALARFTMPTELRNRVARIDIAAESTAAATVLLDSRWQRRPVGLVAVAAGGPNSPLLDDLYYVERAMSPFAEIRRGSIAELLKRDLSLVVLPDTGTLSDDDQHALHDWVDAGGTLLRLAGPKLAHSPDDLLPVTLRGGGRMLGGAMSWTQPMQLAPMPDTGPFAGLTVPDDVRVSAQVLAEPELDLNRKSWARLADGTPLVTGAALGHGWLVLLHTTAWPEWSNLGLSGLFPDMLHRLLDMSRGVAGGGAERPLPPVELLDGFGHLTAPAGIVESLPAHAQPPAQTIPIGPRHPPGLYGDDTARAALNLAPSIHDVKPFAIPAGARRIPLDDRPAERDLQPPILLAAALLLLLDAIAVGFLGGAFSLRRARTAAPAILASLLIALPGHGRADDAPATMDSILHTRLAYVVTGDARADEASRLGLVGLTLVLAERTTANLIDPVGVDPARDPLMPYPLLYWPVTGTQEQLSPAARAAVNDYLRKGGMIMYDTRDGGQGGTEALRNLTAGIDIPPLAEVTSDHVLTRTFYLLREMPGRLTGAPVFAQSGGDPANDNVSPVVIGGNDYAAAWAVDARGMSPYAVVPGGEEQREMAYRFGVNLVMYALTGSYKSDQVHLPIILERLKK